jgi:hypothetical protein
VAKIISLCAVYGIDAWEMARAGGIRVDDSNKLPLLAPDAVQQLRQSA